jgi:protein ImuB
MPVAEARSLVRSKDIVVVEPNQPDDDHKALLELAYFCGRYSPFVGLEEAAQPDCLLMDITGVSSLFGGERSLADQMERELTRQKHVTQIAIADSVGSAWAAAHFMARSQRPTVVSTGNIRDLVELPVAALRLPVVELKKLNRLGIETVQQLLKLESSSLPARLGPEINHRLAHFLGERHELITPCRPQPRFQTERILEDGTTDSVSIEHLSLMLLQQLIQKLQARQAGTRELRAQFVLEDNATLDFVIRLCEASADVSHISKLFLLKLEQLQLDRPLIGVRWEACDVSALECSQPRLFNSESLDHSRQWSSLLDRLVGRLGPAAVVRPRLLPSPIPEHSVELVPVTEQLTVPVHRPATEFLPFDRPTALCHPPKPVDVRTLTLDGPPVAFECNGSWRDFAHHRGPERIESGWWKGAIVRRDYYWVETTDGRRFWIFRQLTDRRWFLHGEMA